MIREYIVRIEDSLKNAQDDIEELERNWGAEELPKGHGRLIDADILRLKWVFGKAERQEIDNAPTIIDKDGKE